eukprot:TRINITY_DN105298_c1_g1_i1.p1 TRINITY_DN105298_c1_g1~~TRINITY_DN105298_c1_g1_i1.p1  ORF type:complete len:481 (+),score=21.97 TRINITY_DN105298_c1_g1_i1:107-1444(+)
MKRILLFIELCLVLALANDANLFLGENHEYGHIPIDRNQPQYSIFYWLFRTRTHNRSPPLVVWIEGGPGCSCEQSLFLEHGPYRLQKGSSNFTSSQFSWNNVADVLYTDQPIGTGLSNCSDISRIPTNADEMARDFYGFFTNFLALHPEYTKHSTTIYFAGHSYAGHFVPAIVKYLLENGFGYHIGGVLLGNPHSDPHALAWSYPTFAYKNGLIREDVYIGSMIARYLYELFDYLGWKEAALLFIKLARGIAAGIFKPRFNQADIKNRGMPVNYFEHLMHSKILKALGMEDRGWANCNPIISRKIMDMDHLADYTPYLEFILNRKINLIFYYGDKDFICSTESWKYMSQRMNWWGKQEFVKEDSRSWWVNGEIKGTYKHYGNMWYFKVYNAGHIVFYYEPEAGLDLISKAIALSGKQQIHQIHSRIECITLFKLAQIKQLDLPQA